MKAVTGCRLADLCSLRSADLEAGRITFLATNTKARRDRVAVLPPDLFARVKALAGPTFLWERYTREIVVYLKLRGVPTHRVNPEFSPTRMNWWAKDEIDDFNKSRPGKPKNPIARFQEASGNGGVPGRAGCGHGGGGGWNVRNDSEGVLSGNRPGTGGGNRLEKVGRCAST